MRNEVVPLRIAFETFACVNLVMNTFVLLMSARVASCFRIRWGRILWGAAIGTAYATLSYTWPWTRLALFMPTSAIMAACIAPVKRASTLVKRTGIVIGCAFLLGGTGYALMQALQSRWLALAVASPVAVLCVHHLVRLRTQRAGTMAVRVLCRYQDKEVQIDGYVDSGNRLQDGVTGLPVIVVNEADIRDVLPSHVDPCDLTTLPQGFRLLAISGVCGQQLTMCFRPGIWIWLGGAWQRAQAVVAIAPRPLPEGALVPLSLV